MRCGITVLAGVVLACGLGMQPAWAGGVYRWVDEAGVLHFGDTRQRTTARRVTADSLTKSVVSAAPRMDVNPGFRARITAQCSVATERVKAHAAARTVYRHTATGIDYALRAEQRAAELTALEAEAARYCAPGSVERLWRAAISQSRSDTEIPEGATPVPITGQLRFTR